MRAADFGSFSVSAANEAAIALAIPTLWGYNDEKTKVVTEFSNEKIFESIFHNAQDRFIYLWRRVRHDSLT